jgi:PGF-CTERM protein
MGGRHTLLTATVLTALLTTAAVAPAAAQSTSPSLTVDLAADGDAEIRLVSTYELDDDSEQAAFDELRTNETTRGAYTDRFADRWASVANATENRTGREMSTHDASLNLSRTNSTGIATFTIAWDGLAAVDGDTVTLSEPFASGYTPDRQFTVVLPEGYELTTAAPEPSSSSGGELVYDADTSLDGFEVTAESTAPEGTSTPLSLSTNSPVDGAETTTGGSGPGFGAVGAVLALVATALLAHRRG